MSGGASHYILLLLCFFTGYDVHASDWSVVGICIMFNHVSYMLQNQSWLFLYVDDFVCIWDLIFVILCGLNLKQYLTATICVFFCNNASGNSESTSFLTIWRLINPNVLLHNCYLLYFKKKKKNWKAAIFCGVSQLYTSIFISATYNLPCH